jgi:cysteinyl-tRNA synthetase
MEWDSPWGKGFPGWHLECSVMAKELLGETIDIHTGGIDHIPIHHTNEIAQSESVTGKTLANIWMHANHIKVDGTKMSKSLGNIYTLHDIEEKGYDVRAFKLLVLSKHYRTEGNFTWEILEAAQNRLNNWRAASDLRWQQPESTNKLDLIGFLQNDLDTPGAVAAIDEYLETAVIPNTESLENIRDLLGIDLLGDDISGEQKELVKKREEARSSQDWKQSDEIRDQLQAQGITVRDTENGTIWSRA